MKEEYINLRKKSKEKDDYLNNKLRTVEKKYKRNNNRVEGIPGSENERLDEAEEKLRKAY